ncbi:SAC3 family protein A-like isoform X2 [Phragmites australis]|uniref:SAC3 family protein A-like isoform X2 n=1 Tax=Phragmites australis TaxID=29695 RepID=UPI002D79FC82|nr:SAC3 family protein A-like isoform X2 [Phragmites australis]
MPTIIIATHKLQMILLSSKEQTNIQTAPGYGSSSYYYQNNTWNGGSSGNNYAPSYQNYSSSDANALQSSTSVPANSLPYQQQYNQWPYYYDHSVPSASSNPVAGNSTADSIAVNTSSGYSYPSSQPPPPGTTSWKSNYVASASVAPPMKDSGIPGPQNQYANQAEDQYSQAAGVPWSQNHYANQASAYSQNTLSWNHAPLRNLEDQRRTVDSKGPSLNILSVNHVSEKFQQNLQGSVTTDTSSESKIQIPTNPQIDPGFSMVMPKSEKKNLGADLSKKPAYVSISMPTNDAKATQVGSDDRFIPFSLRNYAMRNLNRCKDDAQRAACRSMMEEIMSKAIADGTLLTMNWNTEPLFPLPESVVAMTEKSNANNPSPFSSASTPRKRVKSRWEPVVDEKVTNKVEQIAKVFVNSNIHSTSEPKNRTGGSWDHGKFHQSRQAPLNKVNQRPAKKQKIYSNSSQIQNGNASSDSDKEHDLTKCYASATALANSPEEKKRREHRSKRFEKNQDSSLKSRNSSANKNAVDNMHTRRASSSLLTRTYEEGTSMAVEDMDWDALTVKGTCQEIEKRYLRLTSAPDPSTVRPEDVLEKALAMVETSEKNYLYKCDQLKSIRQDLTVQRIQNELTVKVYETHARLAMQAGDLPEYNQCQSQLKRLYAEGIKGCYSEFSAYNLLCVMLHSNNKRDLLSSMASLSKEAKQDGAVKHALAVHAAVLSGNYVLFFKLYKQAPNLNSCLMDLYVERIRFEAMKCMSKSYRLTVPVGYVAHILGFLRSDSEGCVINGDDGSEECEIWLKAHGAVLSVDNGGELQIDMKASAATLYMPEPENAVAHGDASLAVNDFFARAS